MVIEVTEEHIQQGQREACRSCPVALAIRDAFSVLIPGDREYAEFAVRGWSTDGLTAWTGCGAFEFPLPKEVGEWVARFDEAGHGEPFSFEVSDEKIPAHYLLLGEVL